MFELPFSILLYHVRFPYWKPAGEILVLNPKEHHNKRLPAPYDRYRKKREAWRDVFGHFEHSDQL
ncbi:hypothetical protein J41TS2_25920 [Bacillus sonorensis]|nr:hypothetical protein J41TS2_25920 [Bacillus sonorensis]